MAEINWRRLARHGMLSTLACGQEGGCCTARNVRFGSKADMCSALGDVRFVPEADIEPLSFDHFVGAGEK